MLTADRSRARGAMVPRTVVAAVLAASFLVLSGCGGGSGAEPNDFGCLSPEQAEAGYVTFTSSENQEVEAYATGKGGTALILAHQVDSDVCQWVPHAGQLAADGYRVIAVNSTGSEVAELTAAVTYARSKGAHKVLLMGASMGGAAVLEAAGSITPPVDGVVALSAPAHFNELDAAGAVPGLAMPVLYMASEGDTAFADSTRKLSRATTKAAENDLAIVVGTNHGVGMLDVADNLARVRAFLRKYGG